jgi:hypothetical protein
MIYFVSQYLMEGLLYIIHNQAKETDVHNAINNLPQALIIAEVENM